MPRSKKSAVVEEEPPKTTVEPKVEEEEVRDEDIEDAETLCTEDEDDVAEEEFWEVFTGLMTDKEGNNVCDILVSVRESIEKQNKIMYKMMQIMQDHFGKK